MLDVLSFQKKICMTELVVQYSKISSPTFFECSDRTRVNASFVYIKNGNVEVNSKNKTILLKKGDLFYIPNKQSFNLKWSSSDKIEYITLLATSNTHDNNSNEKYQLQVINGLDKVYLNEVFSKIFNLMATKERVKMVKALSYYYDFYSNVLPLLKIDNTKDFSPLVIKALSIIDKNYNFNQSIKEIADKCFVSESRLYHLFKEQVGITPTSYRNEKRIQNAISLLHTKMSLEEISEKVGFNSSPYFFEIFKKYTGMTPTIYRNINLK